MQVTYNQFRQVHPRDWTEPVEVINHGKVIGTWFPVGEPVALVTSSTPPSQAVIADLQKALGSGILPERIVDQENGAVHEVKPIIRPGRGQLPVAHPTYGDEHGHRYLITAGDRVGEFVRFTDSLRLKAGQTQLVEIDGERFPVRNP